MQSRGRMGTYSSGGREGGGLGEKRRGGGSAVSVRIKLEVSGACMRRGSSAMDCRRDSCRPGRIRESADIRVRLSASSRMAGLLSGLYCRTLRAHGRLGEQRAETAGYPLCREKHHADMTVSSGGCAARVTRSQRASTEVSTGDALLATRHESDVHGGTPTDCPSGQRALCSWRLRLYHLLSPSRTTRNPLQRFRSLSLGS